MRRWTTLPCAISSPSSRISACTPPSALSKVSSETPSKTASIRSLTAATRPGPRSAVWAVRSSVTSGIVSRLEDMRHDGMPVMETRIPVLWISGPPGAGKSTVSWQLFTDLARAGTHVAFADTDQFCMCYPAPPGDPDREVIRVRNAGALVPRFRAAGAQCVIANGVLDPVRDLFPELMPQAEVTLFRLRAGRDESVRERCRDWPGFSGSLSPPGREDGADR